MPIIITVDLFNSITCTCFNSAKMIITITAIHLPIIAQPTSSDFWCLGLHYSRVFGLSRISLIAILTASCEISFVCSKKNLVLDSLVADVSLILFCALYILVIKFKYGSRENSHAYQPL